MPPHAGIVFNDQASRTCRGLHLTADLFDCRSSRELMQIAACCRKLVSASFAIPGSR